MVTRNKLLGTCASLLVSGLLNSADCMAYELPMNMAKLQAMDKITGRVSVIDVPVNGEVKFGSFSIVVRTCKATPPEETPENYAFVDVADTDKTGNLYNIFKGWMISSSPALNAIEHPVYDVWLLKCFNKHVISQKLLTDEQLKDRDGLPKLKDIKKEETLSKEAIIAAENEALAAKEKAGEEAAAPVLEESTVSETVPELEPTVDDKEELTITDELPITEDKEISPDEENREEISDGSPQMLIKFPSETGSEETTEPVVSSEETSSEEGNVPVALIQEKAEETAENVADAPSEDAPVAPVTEETEIQQSTEDNEAPTSDELPVVEEETPSEEDNPLDAAADNLED